MNRTRELQSVPRDTHRRRRLLDRLRRLRTVRHGQAQRRSWLRRVIRRLLSQGTPDNPS